MHAHCVFAASCVRAHGLLPWRAWPAGCSYNFLLYVPYELERLIMFGVLLLADCFLVRRGVKPGAGVRAGSPALWAGAVACHRQCLAVSVAGVCRAMSHTGRVCMRARKDGGRALHAGALHAGALIDALPPNLARLVQSMGVRWLSVMVGASRQASQA